MLFRYQRIVRKILFTVFDISTLKKTKYNESNVTYVTEENTFLSFLDKSTYIEEVKNNAKKF